MGESKLTFAKIVANPDVLSWSQAYNAGKLFAVLALSVQEEPTQKDYLNILGKEIFDTLEQEFFTLETKDLESIKAAILVTADKIPADINCSFTICAIIGNVLYVYILGNGKVILKREEKLGTLLDAAYQDAHSLKIASGFLQDADEIILETRPFADIITVNTLSEFLDNLPPSDAAENLAPIVHEKEEAGAAAIIIAFKAAIKAEPETLETESESIITKPEEIIVQKEEDDQFSLDEPAVKKDKFLSLKALVGGIFSKNKSLGLKSLNHSKKIILTIVIIILIVFALSIGFALKNQQDSKSQAILNSIYPEAEKKYNEGQSLLSLNQNLARDSFSQAKKLLDSGKDQLPKDSKEEKKVLDLLAKVDTALGTSANITSVEAKLIENSRSVLLSAEIENQGLYFTKIDKGFFVLDKNEIYSLNTEGSGKKTVIKNDSDWSTPAGLATYLTNVYVLDKKQNQILKFVQGESDYALANYFADSKPDFSKAVSMAIDSDVYVLFSNGDISKFNKGSAQGYTVSGLDKTFSNPIAIFTDTNTDNVYVLDKGNSRIVVLDKNGAYKNQYQATVIKNAKDFEVLENAKKINILSSGKIYQIGLK